jgi:hypothetical protein
MMSVYMAFGLGLATFVLPQSDYVIVHPEPVRQCLSGEATSALMALYDANPFYLRGDFDGDGKPDHALQVRHKTKGAGVVVCSGSGAVFQLGSGLGGDVFSNKPDDNFFARHWEVMTPQQVNQLRTFKQNVPRPVPNVSAESIAMVWDDGIGLIYWDGKQFRWAGTRR